MSVFICVPLNIHYCCIAACKAKLWSESQISFYESQDVRSLRIVHWQQFGGSKRYSIKGNIFPVYAKYMRMRSQQFIEMDKTKLHGQNMNVLWGVTCLDIYCLENQWLLAWKCMSASYANRTQFSSLKKTRLFWKGGSFKSTCVVLDTFQTWFQSWYIHDTI